MLKFLRGLLIALGIILIGAAIALIIVSFIQINYVVTTLGTSNLDFEWKPLYWFFLGAGALGSLLGGFALGLGVGMPKRTFKQRLKDSHDSATPATSPAPATPAPVSKPETKPLPEPEPLPEPTVDED